MLVYQRVYRMLYPLNIALDFLVSYIKIPWIFPDIYLDILGQHVGFSRHVITCIYILVGGLEHFLWLSISWECHHPHHPIWRTHMFQRGRLNHQPVIIHPSGKSTMFIGGINLPFPVMGGKNGIVFPTWNGTLGNIIQLLGYPHDLLWMGAKSCTMAMTQEPIHWKYLPYIRPFLRPIWY